MSFRFQPAIDDGLNVYELPRPIDTVRVQDAWDFEALKVPLADGETLVGHSRNGVEVSIEGRLGSQAGTLLADEQAMFAELETLRSRLHVNDSASKYDLFLYYDPASGTYRKFKGCTTVRFDWDISEKSLFRYAVMIHTDDPTLYTTGPGT